ncbi:MAG: DMT family transporter [Spirochaetota bacterium]|nr:DMT family transporter [Spirochaetota bacterium]
MRKMGYLYMFLSTVSFAFMAVFVKSLSPSMPSHEIAFWRSFIVSGLIVIFLFWRPAVLKPLYASSNPKSEKGIRSLIHIFTRPILLFRGILGAIALFLYFEAISQISVSEAIMLLYTAPVFTAIFSFLFLKEPFQLSTLLFLLLAMIGVSLITKPSFQTIETGKIYALLAAVFVAASTITVKKAGETYSSWVIVLAFTLVSTLLPLPHLIYASMTISISLLTLILAVSVTTLLGQLFMTHSFRYLDATTGSVLFLLTIVNGTILGYMFLGESLDIYSLIGGSLIIISGVKIGLSRAKPALATDSGD